MNLEKNSSKNVRWSPRRVFFLNSGKNRISSKFLKEILQKILTGIPKGYSGKSMKEFREKFVEGIFEGRLKEIPEGVPGEKPRMNIGRIPDGFLIKFQM